MSFNSPSASRVNDARQQFLAQLETCIAQNTLVKLVLSKYRGAEVDLQRVVARLVTVKGKPCVSFVHRYKTRDITSNLPPAEALSSIAGWLPGTFKSAHLLSLTDELQLTFSKKDKPQLFAGNALPREAPAAGHDREKKRFLELTRPFLTDLGVTNSQHQLIPAMARKWKQINKFIEVFSHALQESPLDLGQPLHAADFGSGKGYLTFAMHDYLRNSLGLEAWVTGVELRQEMVDLCNAAAAKLPQPGLLFRHGDVRSYSPGQIDIMIALHACDVATDYAIHLGIRSKAAIIMCSPCCHKQIRPQMHTPQMLRPMLQYGVHLGQEAEMVTDSLRALLLEACGYSTKVFEFVSLEHTNKNKMILAVRRAEAVDPAELLAKIEAIKAFYGIREQCLETLLKADGRI
ncbi:class I SAM-dependent methyltransferase [Pseudomonas sp. N040]|uniref:class I SAM-dependent methyltransferase n=1 Tax=Pseudomonas sp. N040 TaxID=2785325 RepID=UPI0018A2E341|nr:SAM-dependent methyltransferase [Pseudomonas sp. N040]MBF7729333.1 SAM-dependent methyltransferase [Pseudomonas sp. N040]MBW7012973.1 SAM-dependent methyltransferase [Pseudomonas sp. N040]